MTTLFKVFRMIIKQWKTILISVIVLLLLFGLLFHKSILAYLHSPCNSNWQNFKVEFIAGIVFIIVPVFFGIYFGTKIKEYQFYNSVEGVLNTLKKLRENGLVNSLTTRQVVKSVANNFGNDALKEEFAERAFNKFQQEKHNPKDKCRICNLDAEIENKRCKYCKMNCYAWDLSSATAEEKEIAEIAALANTINKQQ